MVNGLEVFQGSLIVGGYFTSVDGGVSARSIASWDGSAWSPIGDGFGSGAYGDYQYVFAVCATDNGLYASGNFTSSGDTTIGDVSHWNGQVWESLASGTDGYGVYALAPDHSGVYAGGYFLEAGGVESYYIGRWWEDAADAPPGEAAGIEAVPDLRIPNPYRTGDQIILRLGLHPSHVTEGRGIAVLYNVAGARVRTFPFDASGGAAVLVWDGRTDIGVHAGVGVYFLTIETRGGRLTRRLVLMP